MPEQKGGGITAALKTCTQKREYKIDVRLRRQDGVSRLRIQVLPLCTDF